MIIYSIYKATNIVNGKVYIGFTKNVSKRIQYHQKSKKSNNPFHNAIHKYGVKNFTWEILYQSKDHDHTLNAMEPYFIREYNSFIDFENSNGYNATLGGGKKYKYSKKSISLISDSVKKQWLNNEYKNKMINCNKTKWTNQDFLTKRDKGWEIITPSGEKIICINLAEFCRLHNLDNGSMTRVSKQFRSHHKGYKCKRISFVKNTIYS